MPSYSLTRDEAIREVAEVENALFDGFPGTPLPGSRHKGAIRVAAERLLVCPEALRRRVGSANSHGSTSRKFGMTVDWGMYREIVSTQSAKSEAQPDAPEQPSDPIDLRRLKDKVTFLTAALAEAQRRAGDAEDYRASILGLTAEPLKPRLAIPTRRNENGGGRSIILHLSDIHYGETVSIDEMDGLNRYDAALAKTRMGRFFAKAAELATEHWKGEPPDEIVLCLGGDLISGLIHPELMETNYPSVPHTVREVGEHIAGGIVVLRSRVQCPIRVYAVPGNHGRSCLKPQSKGRAGNSFDLLASDFAESAVRGGGISDVPFYRSSSPDAYFSVYGWHWLLSHGDTMGGRGGGTGFIGPAATIIKGHRKLVDTSWRSGRPVHYVLTAHYHTTIKTSFGWSNGSVVGYGEYARDLRADPEGCRQNMLVVNQRHGVIDHLELHLGHQSEGSLYAGPATIMRPELTEAA